MPAPEPVEPVDPFDLPDWIGEQPVLWTASTSLGGVAHVAGTLTWLGESHPCDVLACDVAYPRPILGEGWRHDAHQAWALGEVLLLRYAGRLALVVPGSEVAAEPTLEAVRRLAKAVGAPADRFTVAFRL